VDDNEDGDSDFIMNGGDSDDNFDVDSSPVRKSKKAKGKGKQKAQSSSPTLKEEDMLPAVEPSGNPRVMLISLKAGLSPLV
jgi:hypothetical protein